MRRRVALERGRSLRILSAMEVLEARREAEELAQTGAESALCANACLVARALEKHGRAVFHSGKAVLTALPAGEIGRLARRWALFSRAENPSAEDTEERTNALKKAWSTRLICAFSGVCSALLGRYPPRRGHGR